MGLLQQSPRVAWADVQPEVDVPHADEAGCPEQNYQTSCSDNSHKSSVANKGCSRNNRTRRSRRKAQGDNIVWMQEQKHAEQPEPTPVVSRSVDRNVVTWSDLMHCSDTSPGIASQASTATSSPIQSPPLSARTPCYAVVADSSNSIPVVLLPTAVASSGNLGPLLRTLAPSPPGAPIADNNFGNMEPSGVRASACPFGASHAHMQGGPNAMMHVLYQEHPGLKAASSSPNQLEELLHRAAQTPYED